MSHNTIYVFEIEKDMLFFVNLPNLGLKQQITIFIKSLFNKVSYKTDKMFVKNKVKPYLIKELECIR